MRVGVIYGGIGSEYNVSLQSGRQVLDNLPGKYEGRDVLIDKEGLWHFGGFPTAPERIARQVDVFFNALHGTYGEDGQVQQILERLARPYTGSGVAPSALGMNKSKAKEIFRQAGIKVPPGTSIELDGSSAATLAERIFRQVSPPWVIKPTSGGSSMGLMFARNLPELREALRSVASGEGEFLVEHYLRGREATCGAIDNFRGREVYALPPIEIRRPNRSPVWTYDDKYNGATEEICPGPFEETIRREIEELSLAAHRALGLRHYSRADFIVSPHGLYLLEVNSLPGLTKESLLPKALGAVGCGYGDFLDHVITLATRGEKI